MSKEVAIGRRMNGSEMLITVRRYVGGYRASRAL